MQTEYRCVVSQEWLDYNGHMNIAYYSLAFDKAAENFLASAGLDATEAEMSGDSWMVAEAHLTYQQEALHNEHLIVDSRILALDNKRLHLFQQMKREQDSVLLATIEQLILHVNLKNRKVSPFASSVLEQLESAHAIRLHQQWPKESGRFISLESRKPGQR